MAPVRRFGAPRLAILALGGAGGALLVVSDFLTLYHVDVLTARCSDLASPNLRDACSTTGGGHHGYGLAIIGALVLVMTWGAAIGSSRPAGAALLVLGGAALLIVFAVDAPDIHRTGIVGEQFANAEANPIAGYWLEIVGAGLALGAGAVRLLSPKTKPRAS